LRSEAEAFASDFGGELGVGGKAGNSVVAERIAYRRPCFAGRIGDRNESARHAAIAIHDPAGYRCRQRNGGPAVFNRRTAEMTWAKTDNTQATGSEAPF